MNTKTKKTAGEKLTTAELIKKAKSTALPTGEGQGGVLDSPSPFSAELFHDTKHVPRRSALRPVFLIKDGVHDGNHYEIFAGTDRKYTTKGSVFNQVIVVAIRDQAFLLDLDSILGYAAARLPEKTVSSSLPSGEGQGGVLDSLETPPSSLLDSSLAVIPGCPPSSSTKKAD